MYYAGQLTAARKLLLEEKLVTENELMFMPDDSIEEKIKSHYVMMTELNDNGETIFLIPKFEFGNLKYLRR